MAKLGADWSYARPGGAALGVSMVQNGRLDTSTLVRAANGTPQQLVERQTGIQLSWMVRDAAKNGVTLVPQADWGIASCYRDIAGQQRAWDSQPPTAAPVGYSNHGWGTAVDFVITPVSLSWLNANAYRYGFSNAQGQATVPSENWHWVRVATVNPPVTEGKEVAKTASFVDTTQQEIKPGGYTFMKSGKSDANIAGGGLGATSSSGTAQFLPHIYFEGTAGDQIEVTLVWENINSKPSPSAKASYHYPERSSIGTDGKGRYSGVFSNKIGTGDMVFVKIANVSNNPITVTHVAADVINFN